MSRSRAASVSNGVLHFKSAGDALLEPVEQRRVREHLFRVGPIFVELFARRPEAHDLEADVLHELRRLGEVLNLRDVLLVQVRQGRLRLLERGDRFG